MRIQTLRLGELQANCYMLEEDGQCIIIDPADDAGFLLEEISRQNLELLGLLATHGHFDHVMAAGEIQLSVKIPLYVGKEDIFLIRRLRQTARHFLGYEPFVIQPTIIEPLSAEKVEIGPFTLEVIRTPGHTPGSASFYMPEEQIVFTGDTLFRGSVGRTDLSYSNKNDLHDSLINLFKLPEETVVYSGHGDETTIMAEKTAA